MTILVIVLILIALIMLWVAPKLIRHDQRAQLKHQKASKIAQLKLELEKATEEVRKQEEIFKQQPWSKAFNGMVFDRIPEIIISDNQLSEEEKIERVKLFDNLRLALSKYFKIKTLINGD